MKLLLHHKNLFLIGIVFLAFQVAQSQDLTDEELKTWWQKDLRQDSIPGVGLERVYKELIKSKKGQEVIVAVLDTKLDIDHEDLKDQIWVNKDEIPNNGIDDDKNGYIDDVNGWNFLGNSSEEELDFQSLEIVRVINAYRSKYNENSNIDIPDNEKEEYERATKELNDLRFEYQHNVNYLDSLSGAYQIKKKDLLVILNGNKYSTESLDSLANNDLIEKEEANWMKQMIDWGIEEDIEFEKPIKFWNNVLQKLSNLNYNERQFIDGGNNRVKNNALTFQHSTPVSGLIASKRNNDIGINGFSNQIKIMPVVMVSYGDEHDEDVAKAIRYAVDNGAEIINMSWGKYYSTQKELVKKAFKYAAQHNVLLVSGSGNDSKNIDIERSYPTDFYDNVEVSNSFINAGGITHNADSTLVSSFSNYGVTQVDLMAPASAIYSSEPDNAYSSSGGTSFASPMVAGTAALLKSYFPNLTAVQLKEIILSSSTKLDMMVKRPGDEEDAPLVPFSSLSKTGSILNTYAAFKKAMEITKQ